MRLGLALALLMLVPAAGAYHGQQGEAGLVSMGPVEVDGAVVAIARPGAAYWSGAHDFDLTLTARHVDVERVTHREETGVLAVLAGPPVTRASSSHADATVHLLSRGHAFQFLAFPEGAAELRASSTRGGVFSPHPPGGIAPSLEAQRQGLDRFGEDAFSWGLYEHGARFRADAPRVTAVGDFTLFVYDALLRVDGDEGSETHRTGVAQERGARTVTYALLHVRGGQMTVAASPAFAGLYSSGLDLSLNGTARFASAYGEATVGEERMLARGASALSGVLEGHVAPTPRGDGLHVQASGDMTSLSLSGATREFAPPVVQLSLAVAALAVVVWLVKHGGVAALYSRFAGAEVLRHRERERALALLRERPGLSVQEMADALGISWSTAAYHLGVLEREGMVAAAKGHRHRRYVLVGTGVSREEVHVASHPTASALLMHIASAPGVSQSRLSELAGITPSTASWHLKRLAEAGLVRVERKWRTAHYFARRESMP